MKWLNSNITVENYLSSLKNLSKELPSVISEWNTFDSDLQEEYIDQMQWLIMQAVEFIGKKTGNNDI